MKNGNPVEVYDFTKYGASPFRYAPPTLPLFRPLAELPHETGRLLWFVLQLTCYGLGFLLIGKTMSGMKKDAPWIVALSFLFVLRFSLDSFTIGQVTGFIFLGLCLGIWAWIRKKPYLTALGLFLPVCLKIGPGILLGLFCTVRPRFRAQVFLAGAALLAMFSTLILMLGIPLGEYTTLFSGWWNVVANDSSYFDAAHYGSQSIKSALLRLAGHGLFSREAAEKAWVSVSAIGSLSLLAFWSLRTPKNSRARGLFYSLGILAYLAFMPETFKYAMPVLAIPIAFLFASSLDRFDRFAIGFGAAVMSLAGLDIIGATLFFWLQKSSVPVIALVFISVAVFRHAMRESVPSRWARRIRWVASAVPAWDKLPKEHPTVEVSALVPLPLDSRALTTTELCRRTLTELHSTLDSVACGSFEILVIPHGDRLSEAHPLHQLLKELQASKPEFKFLPAPKRAGSAVALQSAFLESLGRRIVVANTEQPCNSDFFATALRLLGDDLDLIRANRRHADSQFDVPVSLLPLAFKRHRLGLAFNRITRLFLDIRTPDAHSGSFVMSRRLALAAFSNQSSPGLLFDLETSITAQSYGWNETSLPIVTRFMKEKSETRLWDEIGRIVFRTPVLAWRKNRGCYSPLPSLPGLTADDWGMSPKVNSGILELARCGVLKRVSILANGRFLEDGLEDLLRIPGLELGLHLNLSYGLPLPSAAAYRVIAKSPNLGEPVRYLGVGKLMLLWFTCWGIKRRTLLSEVHRSAFDQLERARKLGIPIQYLDSHHHMHLLPGILEDIAGLLRDFSVSRVRLPYSKQLWWSRKIPINLLSVLAKAVLKRHGLETAPFFYPKLKRFSDQGKLRAEFAKHREFEIVVHPAQFNDISTLADPDSYQEERVIEFHALRMLAYPETERGLG